MPKKLQEDSNPNPKTIVIVKEIYTLHRIHSFPSPLVPKKATGVEEAGGSGGGSWSRLGVTLLLLSGGNETLRVSDGSSKFSFSFLIIMYLL
jgi:hypothetical protein